MRTRGAAPTAAPLVTCDIGMARVVYSHQGHIFIPAQPRVQRAACGEEITRSAWLFSPQAPARPSVAGPAPAEMVCTAVRQAGRTLRRGGNTAPHTAPTHAPPTRRHTSQPCRPVLHRWPAPMGLRHTHTAARVRRQARAEPNKGCGWFLCTRRQQPGQAQAQRRPQTTHFGAAAACAARCCTAARQRPGQTQGESPWPAFPPATTRNTLAGATAAPHCAAAVTAARMRTRPSKRGTAAATVAGGPNDPSPTHIYAGVATPACRWPTMSAALTTMGVVPSAGAPDACAASHCARLVPRRFSVLTCRASFQACTSPCTAAVPRGCARCRLCA